MGSRSEADSEPLVPIERDAIGERSRRALQVEASEFEEISLSLLRNVFDIGIRDQDILESIVYLSLYSNSQIAKTRKDYAHHVLTFAHFLAWPSRYIRKSAKLACIRALMTLVTPLEAGWQLQERVIQHTLGFITNRTYSWEYLDHSHEILLWELRAVCLNAIERRSSQLSEIFIQGTDRAAELISRSACCVERGLEQSTGIATDGIEGAASRLRQFLKPEDVPLLEANLRAKIVALTYSEHAKLASDGAREATCRAMTAIHTSSANCIYQFANRLYDEKLGPRLVPHQQSRELLLAVGRIGVAAVAGAAIVADSLVQSSATVAETTAAVTAEIVEHKYGPAAGKFVRNSSDTIGNIFRTAGHASLISKRRAMANAVTRETGMHLIHLSEKTLYEESDASEMDCLMIGPENWN